jgi:SpoU rRNA methylase family enzyme
MSDTFLGLKTNATLLNKLQQAASHKPSPSEILEQRVSFAFSSMKPSSGVTRERVRQVILEQDGGAVGADK